jgi:L-fuculose-phosphate aldolase
MIARSGGDNIRCAPYATFGTQELSDYAVKALQAGLVCLLAH